MMEFINHQNLDQQDAAWTAELDGKLLGLFKSDKHWVEIENEMGMTRGKISGRIQRLRIRLGEEAVPMRRKMRQRGKYQ